MKQLPDVEPHHRTAPERFFAGALRGVRRVGVLRSVLLWPVFTRPGYWFATVCALIYGLVLGGRLRKRNGMHYIPGLPAWAFGRGGTTIGAIYLTRDNDGDGVLEHEAEHRAQWRRYGLWFIPLYIAAGAQASTNRFEVAAGLELGGYVRKRPR